MGKDFHSFLIVYEDRAKSDYDILLEQAKAEIKIYAGRRSRKTERRNFRGAEK